MPTPEHAYISRPIYWFVLLSKKQLYFYPMDFLFIY